MKDPLLVRCRKCGRAKGSHVHMVRGDLCQDGRVFKATEKLVKVRFYAVPDTVIAGAA